MFASGIQTGVHSWDCRPTPHIQRRLLTQSKCFQIVFETRRAPILSPREVRCYLSSSLPLCFLPSRPCVPRCPYAGMPLSFVLHRPCSSYLSLMSPYAFSQQPFRSPCVSVLLNLCSVFALAFGFFCLVLACIVVFSYPVRRHFTCFAYEIAIVLVFSAVL